MAGDGAVLCTMISSACKSSFEEFSQKYQACFPSIEFKNGPYGLSTFARRRIERGQLLFRVPHSMTIREQMCETSEMGQKIREKFDPIAFPARYIMYCFCIHHRAGVSGDAQNWHTWLSTLAASYDDPLQWEEQDLIILEGTNLRPAVATKSDQLRKLFDEVVTHLTVEEPDLFPKDVFTWYVTNTE